MGIRKLVLLMILLAFTVSTTAAAMINSTSLSTGDRFDALRKEHAEMLALIRQKATEPNAAENDYLAALVAQHRQYRMALLDLRQSATASDDDHLAEMIDRDIEKSNVSILEAEERFAQGDPLTADPGDRLPEGLERGLVLHYPFDQSRGSRVMDASGLGNHGFVHGARWSALGRRDGSFWLDGGDDYIETPDTDSLRTDRALTLSVCIFREPDEGLQTGLSEFILSKADITNADYILSITANHTVGAILKHHKEGKPPIRLDSDPARHKAGVKRWVHVVFVYNGHIARTYIDGEHDKTVVAPGGIGMTKAPLNIGRCGNGSWQYGFTGRLDDVFIWNRALSEAEVLGLWVSLKRSTESPGQFGKD